MSSVDEHLSDMIAEVARAAADAAQSALRGRSDDDVPYHEVIQAEDDGSTPETAGDAEPLDRRKDVHFYIFDPEREEGTYASIHMSLPVDLAKKPVEKQVKEVVRGLSQMMAPSEEEEEVET